VSRSAAVGISVVTLNRLRDYIKGKPDLFASHVVNEAVEYYLNIREGKAGDASSTQKAEVDRLFKKHLFIADIDDYDSMLDDFMTIVGKVPEVKVRNAAKEYPDVAGILRLYLRECKFCGKEFATDIEDRWYCNTIHREISENLASNPDRVTLKLQTIKKAAPIPRKRKGE
jgi:hypothetical protein